MSKESYNNISAISLVEVLKFLIKVNIASILKKNKAILTSNNKLSVQEKFDSHCGITDGLNASFKMNFAAFNLSDISQWDNELRWWIHAILFHWSCMWLSTFNMSQVNNFWTWCRPVII
jgi:hypothetical protein